METIVVDANIVVALFDEQDSTHEQAVALMKDFHVRGSRLVMVNLAVYEALTVLHMKDCRTQARAFYEVVRTNPRIYTVYVTGELESRAYLRFREAASKNMSFADCAIIAVAEAVNASAIASFDSHIKRCSKVVP
ncbi:MAG: PIN domain-containing protein, partial [Patescibacteria group bacterium]|nr:PIN domain-containing protein [Patescibacteria group bacterium]